jgi:septum formation topological specificity factor MinE
MAIDKALYQAPQGIEEEAQALMGEPDIEIEIEDPESVSIKAGGLEILIDADEEGPDFYANIAEEIDESELESIGSELLAYVKDDLDSRKDWEKTYKEGLVLLGLKYEERTEPWDGACGVFHPMITEAVVRFQSETIMETFPAQGPVKTKIIGKDTRQKEEAAARVKEDMNYELTERMPEFRMEHERMLWNLPATGSAFKKVYFDPNLQRQTSVFVPAEDIIVAYGTVGLESAERVTHRMYKTSNEIRKLQVAGFYRDIELGEPTRSKNELQEKKDKESGMSSINDDRYVLYEIHANLDLPGYEDMEDDEPTGIAIPYVVTVLEGTNEVLSIRRNYYEDDDTKKRRDHFVHYVYIPGFGFYGFGLFHLIGGFAKSATSIMRQLVDAGTLSNLPGGLKSRGLRIKGDDTPIAPGEFRDVDVGAGALRDNILPLPYKEPSATLYQLLGTIVEEGRRFAATADMKISDMSAQAPVGTTLALLERMLKVMSAVQARVHYAFKHELKLLAAIIRDYTDDDYTYDPASGPRVAKRVDYDMVEIIPVSDPNAATMSQRVVQYQAVIQLAQMAPQVYDIPALHRQMLEVLGIRNAAKLVPMEDDQTPKDPITENMNALKLKPMKAFMYQDHAAHIQTHMNMMQDPAVAALIGQNPQASLITGALQAHIAEHLGYQYRRQVQEAVGTPLPGPEEKIPEAMEVQISKMVAEGSQIVLAQSQQAQAQQQALQNAQDPIMMAEMQKLQIQQSEVQRKAQKDQADTQIKMLQLQLDQLKAEQQAELEGTKLGIQIGKDQAELALKQAIEAAKQQLEGTKIGVDIAKNTSTPGGQTQ